ncbi:PREDICTED: transforming growth factor-beta-induced protein ig-h3-like [Branchiostoma belcheri]|uniref:Transforming growth factor-beta-induced protein ig-h3-like n=1 Tax=Branchiostoma belcheri TaxID=7741 RepID=A0A6P4YZ06_BRABE|nr:PREDICTED: transforming growth factor-beta-induced protein ig-h3-like [Branchiostoma belcheri]
MRGVVVFVCLVWMGLECSADLQIPIETTEGASKTVVDEISALKLTSLASFLDKAKLTDALKGKGPFTVFAPADEAFKRLSKPVLDALNKGTATAKDVLQYHVVSGHTIMSKDLKNDETVGMLNKRNATINVYQHMNAGKIYTINGVDITKADNKADNGVVHEISRVLYPFPNGTVGDLIKYSEAHKTLCQLLDKSKLMTTLQNTTQMFTLFAPTDAAFKLANMTEINKLNNTELSKVLLRHVLPDIYYQQAFYDNESIKTLSKETMVLIVGVGGVSVVVDQIEGYVNNPNHACTNGVVHAIDRVLFK